VVVKEDGVFGLEGVALWAAVFSRETSAHSCIASIEPRKLLIKLPINDMMMLDDEK
jgi:hypothetical protein